MSATFVKPQRYGGTTADAGSPTDLRVASLGKRVAAVLLDGCVSLLIAAVPLGILWLVVGGGPATTEGYFHTITAESTSGQILRAIGESFVVVLAWVVYAGVLTSRSGSWNGQTVGKRAAQLRIVGDDGGPLTPAAAWKRVLSTALLISVVVDAFELVDVLFGTQPTATHIGSYLAYGISAVAVLCTLRGEQRQTLFDRIAKTVVVVVPVGAPAAADATGADPAAATTFTQAPAASAQPLATSHPAIIPRTRTAKTWTAVVAAALLTVAMLPLGRAMEDLELPQDRKQEILAMPETKAVLADLRTLEALAVACLATDQGTDACDERGELGAQHLEFAEYFDLERDALGEHAGKVAALADGDDSLILYGFTAGDRLWSSVIEGDDVQHVCIKVKSDDLCDGVYDW